MSKVYEVITGQIVEQLERGVVPWARPWKVDGLAPSNLVSRRPYRGINVFLLGFRAASTPWWLTFRQAKALGGSVLAGERSTPVIFWRWVDRAERGIDDSRVRAVVGSAIGGVPTTEGIRARLSDLPAIERLTRARACFRLSTEGVTRPPRSAFAQTDGYGPSLLHQQGTPTIPPNT